MNKKNLSEADIKAKYITPSILKSGWDEHTQLGREIFFTDGRIYVKRKLTARGKRKFADYILFYKPNVPIAIIEAKDNKHTVKVEFNKLLTTPTPWIFLVCSAVMETDFIFTTKPQQTGKLKKKFL